jgi:hypothetical protein
MTEKPGTDAEPDIATDEADDTYYIEGDLDVMGHLTACQKCGRKLVVELALIGVPHHVGVYVTCGNCLVLPGQFRKEQPAISAKIDGWLHDGQSSKQHQS